MDRVRADKRSRRHFCAVFFVLVEMEVRVLALDDLDTAVIAVMDLHAVGAAIGPSGFLVLGYQVDAVPIKRPPSSGLKKGTGKASISTSFPSMTISKTGPESTILALTGFFMASSIHSRACRK